MRNKPLLGFIIGLAIAISTVGCTALVTGVLVGLVREKLNQKTTTTQEYEP